MCQSFCHQHIFFATNNINFITLNLKRLRLCSEDKIFCMTFDKGEVVCILMQYEMELIIHLEQKHYNLILAHLSQRLIGELIGYPWSGVRPSSSSTMFEHLLLRNRWADQSQILCGASLGRGNENSPAASGSHGGPISTKLSM